MTEVDAQAVSAAFPPPLSTLVLTHNTLFQAQLHVMHVLVEKQRVIPGGYELLEQLLNSGGGGTDGVEEGAGGKRRAVCQQQQGHDSGMPSPETGCDHGQSFCKNLCKSCYQRWRRRVSKGGGGRHSEAGGGRSGSFSSVGDDDDDDDSSLGFLSGMPMDDGDLSQYGGLLDSEFEEEGEEGAGGEEDDEATMRLEEASWASSKRTSVSQATAALGGGCVPLKKRAKKGGGGGAGGRRAYGSGARRGKKGPDLCVQCQLRPTLCRALCNGCYQKWHKQKKLAEERGLPPVPCPSIAILGDKYEERVKGRSVAEATPAGIAAAIAAATARAQQQQMEGVVEQQQRQQAEGEGEAVAVPGPSMG